MATPYALDLLQALADGEVHSGQALAQQFGLSRAGLAKRVQGLRDCGLTVIAHAGRGYQLPRPFEALDAVQLRAVLTPHVAVRVEPWLSSTNSELLLQDGHDPQFLCTEWQSAGRGRRGKTWLGGLGQSLMFSFSVTLDSWPPRLGLLPLVLATALAQTLRPLGVPACVKWPNDLLCDGKKLAGMLIEPRGEAGGGCRLVMGLGVNMAAPSAEDLAALPASAPQAPTGVWAYAPELSRNRLLAALAQSLWQALQQFVVDGPGDHWPERWAAVDFLAARQVQVLSQPPLLGEAKGVDADGALLLWTADGLQRVHAGEVSVRW